MSDRTTDAPAILGEGTYGCVFLETDKENGKVYAVKESKRQSDESGITVSCLRECDVYSRFSHTFFPTVLSIHVTPSHSIQIRMELAACSLQRWLENTALTFSDRVRMAAQMMWNVLHVLIHLHGHGIIHRDIKPDNILVYETAQGATAYLSDMGSCRLLNPRTQAGACSGMSEEIGTIQYRAPELNTKVYGKSSDVYSLGCTAIHVLAGCSPRRRRSATEADFIMPQDWNNLLKSIKNQTPDAMYDVIRSMIHTKATDRIPAAEALKHVLYSSAPYRKPLGAVRVFPFPGDYITGKPTIGISYDDRAKIIEWLFSIAKACAYSHHAVVHGVHVMDDFLALTTSTIEVSDAFLYAACCLWIATKYIDGICIPIDYLYKVCSNQYDTARFVATEETIVRTLEYAVIRRPIDKNLLMIMADQATLSVCLCSPEYCMGRVSIPPRMTRTTSTNAKMPTRTPKTPSDRRKTCMI